MTMSMWETECEIGERQLLQCVVEVARAAFRAEASSVFVVDDDTGDLVFEAVAGRGEDSLIGSRFSEGTGIAGWVAACGQPVLADDLSEAPFSFEAAQATGFVPRSVAAAPLVANGTCVGVLEVLDRTVDRDELATQELLGVLASQAAVGLELLQRLRHARRREVRIGAAEASSAALLDRITAKLPSLNVEQARLVSRILGFADDLTDLVAAPTARS